MTPPGQAGLSSPKLIGRDRELEAIGDALARQVSVAVVEGEAGIGKSRLIQEALAISPVRCSLIGHCHPVRDPFPLGPVVEALEGLAGDLERLALSPLTGALRPLLPEGAEDLPPAVDPLGDPRAEQHRLFRAAVEVFEAAGPLVLVLEDLHWADERTCEFLSVITARAPAGISVVLTYRAGDLPPTSPLRTFLARLTPSSAVRLHLEPLSPGEVGSLVGGILETDEVSEEFARYLHEQTGGLPFAVEEVLHLLIERGGLIRQGGRWARKVVEELRVPAGVRDSVVERTERLPADAAAVLRAAAVLGEGADERAIRAVVGLPPARLARALEAGLGSGLLREEGPGRYRLRHALAERAIYEAIRGSQRVRLHGRAVRSLETLAQPPVGQLAHHSRRALLRRRWIRYAEEAAALATSLGDDATASRFLQGVLAEPSLPRAVRVRLAVRLGRSALHGLVHQEAVSVLRGILADEPLPTGTRGGLRFSLGLLLAQSGDGEGAVSEIARSVTELRRRPSLAAWAMANLAVPSTLDIHLRGHMDWLRRATAAARRQDDPVVRTAVLADRAAILLLVGDPEGWRALREIPDTASSLEERRHLVRARLNLAQAAYHVGHDRHARRFLEEGLRLSTELSYERQVGALETAGLLLDWSAGAWDELEGRARGLLEQTADVPPAVIDARLVLGLLLLAIDRLREARSLLEETLREARMLGAGPVLAAAAAGLSRAAFARGEAGEARRWAMEGLDLIRAKGIWAWAGEVGPAAVEALLGAGGLDAARSVIEEMARGLRGKDAPAAIAALVRCRALLAEGEGRVEAAARSFARSARAWAELPRPYERARALEGWGRCALSRGRSSGRQRLLEALDLFGSLGAVADASRVRGTLRSHGVVLPHRGGRRGYGDALSPREREVARLVAEGCENREIARRLFLSRKTVEHHVSSVLRKLGIASRRELIRAGAESLGAPTGEPFART